MAWDIRGNLSGPAGPTGPAGPPGSDATVISAVLSSLPAASTVPVGSFAYASNGRKSGESASAGTGIPVWCDGSAWRTYYDNSVAAA